MKIKKLFRIAIASMLVLVGICMSVLNTHAQYKLDLGDKGSLKVFESSNVVPIDSLKSDSISCIGIVLTYADRKENDFFITVGDTINMFRHKAKVTKSLSESEIKSSAPNGLVFKAGESYLINHGDKQWKFQYGEPKAQNAEGPDSVTQHSAIADDPGTVEKGNQDTNIPVAIYILLALLIVLTLGFGGLCFVLYKKLKHNNTDKIDKERPNHNQDNVNSENEQKSEDSSSTEGIENTTNRAEGILDELCGNDKNLSLDNKYELLKKRLANNVILTTAIEKISELLGFNDVDSDVVEIKICQEIETMKTEIKNLKAKEELLEDDSELEVVPIDNGVKEIYDCLLFSCKTNYALKPLVEKAQKKYKSSKDSEKDVLIEVINGLPNFEKKGPSISSDSNVITETQLNLRVNQDILKRWLVSQLGLYGIEVGNPFLPKEDILQKIAQQLNDAKCMASEKSSMKPEEVISRAIVEDRLQEKDRNVLLQRIIDAINSALPSSTKKLNPNMSRNQFVELVASKLSAPSDHEEAMNQVKERNLGVINEVFGSDLKDLTRDQLKMIAVKSVVSIVNKELGTSVETLDEAKAKLREINATLSDLQKKYGVEDPSQLEKAIIDKRFEQIQKSVSSEVEKLLPGEHFDSAQKLVNALIKIAKDNQNSYKEVIDADEMVKDSLQESIATMNQDVLTDGKDLLDLVEIYNTEVRNKERELREEIDGLVKNNEASLTQLNEKNVENETLKKENEILEGKLTTESSEMMKDLYAGAEKIRRAWRPILKGCSEEDENQCMDIEDRLKNNLFEALKSLEKFQVTDKMDPVQTRKEIQNLLIEKLTAENSPFNVIGRYFAYSRLPFMTDTAREYGVIFNRKNIGTLFSAMESLYVHFGINLDIPVLFAMGIEEGEFINVTGQAYGDLDNLCQNSRNHFDNIDSKNKPSEVIVDIVQVGYYLSDSNEGFRPKVLTY